MAMILEPITYFGRCLKRHLPDALHVQRGYVTVVGEMCLEYITIRVISNERNKIHTTVFLLVSGALPQTFE